MYRWSVCPGSVNHLKKSIKKSSSYAEEGTDAHALAAYCLVNNKDPLKLIGHTVRHDDRTVEVDDDMASAVSTYVEHIWTNRKAGDTSYIEHRFDLSKVYPGCFGTADHVVWREAESLLIVRDYKHGAGIFVSPVKNPQLMYYGLGALISIGKTAKRVRLEIIQPRCASEKGAVRAWEIDALDLYDFSVDLQEYAKKTEDKNAPLVPGDHCRFCDANSCPAVKSKTQALAKLEFSPVLAYDPEELSSALDAIPVLEAWIKSTREFAYNEAEEGRPPPRYKIVAKRATRKWRDEEEAAAHAVRLTDHEVDIYERKLKSPAQMEKLVGKGKMDAFITAVSSGHVLVPEDDPRPRVKLTAKEEFTAITDGESNTDG